MNIPSDTKWLFRFDTRSDYERWLRYVRQQKFHATLHHKLDAAEEEWLSHQPVLKNTEWEFTEVSEGETPLGGEMRVNIKSVTNVNNLNDRND